YRKVLLDEELAKKKKDPQYAPDPVLENSIMFFTTHTYGNRREYQLRGGEGDNVLEFMEIPDRYHELFKHLREGGEAIYDMTSAGLRTADGQSAVSRAHADDVRKYDEWVNYTEDPNLAEYYREMGVEVNLLAISNGDHRANTAVFFNEKLRKLFGDDVDVEHPTPEQVFEAKKKAKEELRLAKGQEFYSSHEEMGQGQQILNPDQLVVSYSGRLVMEKAGRGFEVSRGKDGRGAFDDKNIEELVKQGAQVVIYGNVQTNNVSSDALKKGLIELTKNLKEKGYPGKLIFVPRFSLSDQSALLAATDVQVQDSYPRTEAAGFTEADISATGGIEVGTRRDDNNVGEGLFQAQGFPMDINNPGVGNVLVPEKLNAESYLKILLLLLEKYKSGDLKHYQATSVRLSRALEARLTSAAYLREFSKAVEYKEVWERMRKIFEEMKMMEDADKSLKEQLYTPDEAESPEEHAIYEVSRLALKGKTDKAIELFFTSEAFQGEKENLDVPAKILNVLLDAYGKDKTKARARAIRNFAGTLKNNIVEQAGSDREFGEVARAVQLMAGQALTVIFWMKEGVKGSEKIRLTADEGKMIASKKGNSFIDKNTLPEGIGEVKEEGARGFFWRGTEMIKKLGENILKALKFDGERFDGAEDKLVLYLMDHGFIEVPEGLKEATGKGQISTIHETFFINDMLPGSFQTTSTGAGHFQGDKLDVKQVTEGRGIQVNVKYDTEGNIVSIECQAVKAGEFCRALPGYVDYMINLGGLRFNDFSVSLSPEQARQFDSEYNENELEKLAEVVKGHAKHAPYIGVKFKDGPEVVKAVEDVTDAVWVASPFYFAEGSSLLDIYSDASSMGDVYGMVEQLAAACKAPSAPPVDVMTNREAELKAQAEAKTAEKAPSLGKAEGIQTFIDDNAEFLAEVLGPETGADKLIRIPIEAIEAIRVDNIKDFLATFQATSHGYIELFSTENLIDISEIQYKKYGITKKDLPEGLNKDSRNRTNTITVFPVIKGEVLTTGGKKEPRGWGLGDIDQDKSIISPVGLTYDKSGIIRSIFLGLRLSEIAKNEGYTEDSNFVAYTLGLYMDLCFSQGEKPQNFNLTGQDLVNIARGDTRVMVQALNKLIKLLPIMPINTEELRLIYERAKEVLIRA
ncbi:MAG: hypothetical protein ABID83_02625, partial [Candidatus Omnitrophota bacterium]